MPGLIRFSRPEKLRIIFYHNQGRSCSQIMQIINKGRAESRLCTSRGVRKVIKRARQPIVARKRKSRLGQPALDYMNAAIYRDREISAVELQRQFRQKFNLTVSVTVVNRARRSDGRVLTNT